LALENPTKNKVPQRLMEAATCHILTDVHSEQFQKIIVNKKIESWMSQNIGAT